MPILTFLGTTFWLTVGSEDGGPIPYSKCIIYKYFILLYHFYLALNTQISNVLLWTWITTHIIHVGLYTI